MQGPPGDAREPSESRPEEPLDEAARPTEPPPADRDAGGGRAAPSWDAEERRRRAILLARVLVGILLLAIFVVFVSLNSEAVRVHFIVTETRTPLVWVFLVCALIGALATYLLGRPGRRSARKYIKELERRLEERERGR